MVILVMEFEWDENKNEQNIQKHNISFEEAQYAFFDPNRVIIADYKHSQDEERFFCMGKVNSKVVTVRFTMRSGKIRIFGAGHWRSGRKEYEK